MSSTFTIQRPERPARNERNTHAESVRTPLEMVYHAPGELSPHSFILRPWSDTDSHKIKRTLIWAAANGVAVVFRPVAS